MTSVQTKDTNLQWQQLPCRVLSGSATSIHILTHRPIGVTHNSQVGDPVAQPALLLYPAPHLPAVQHDAAVCESRAVQGKCLILAALSTHVAPKPVPQLA